MKIFRMMGVAAVAAAIVGGVAVAPAGAQTQTGGGNRGGNGCTSQATTGGQTQQGAPGGQRASGDAVLGGLINAALNDVQLGVLNGTALQVPASLNVVCLNDVLNGNQLQVLNNILNNSPILNNNLNQSLNNLSALNNLNLLTGARILAVDVGTGNVYVLGR